MKIKSNNKNDNVADDNFDVTSHSSNISEYSLEKTEQTFIELASEQRLSILLKLTEQDTKLSQLAKDLSVTMQEVHRNVNRLMEVGLIKKNAEGTFSLTTFGNTIIKQIPAYDFLSRNKEYFSDHNLGDIPMKFIHRIGALNNSEYVFGLVAVIERWKQLYSESSEYIYGMVPQIPLELIESVIPKIKNDGVKFNYILPQKAIVPKRRTELLSQSGYYDLLKMEKKVVDRRMVDKVHVAVVLNERQATVMFPTVKDQVVADMNSMFYSRDDSLFHEWCLDYFRYCWYNSKPFDESKLLEV
jgi:predicted transcriptional regulator